MTASSSALGLSVRLQNNKPSSILASRNTLNNLFMLEGDGDRKEEHYGEEKN